MYFGYLFGAATVAVLLWSSIGGVASAPGLPYRQTPYWTTEVKLCLRSEENFREMCRKSREAGTPAVDAETQRARDECCEKPLVWRNSGFLGVLYCTDEETNRWNICKQYF